MPLLGNATVINANPDNYTTFIQSLTPGDTLYLASGTYIKNLTLNNVHGTASQPIVIMGNGNTTLFHGQSCCNTVSITQCSYLTIKNLQLDGLNQEIDAVKAEGTANNQAHHITIEYLTIVNYGASQQNVGISTKCPAWNWIIRKNRIIGAGTGMYLGNSDGTKPFVNGIIEYNLIANTVGYNIEIKHQINGQRELLPETSINAKTIIRHNVFTKNESSSTGDNARPNLLVGGFPTAGWGSSDYYEIYGNFFYNNPVEALFQGTGGIMLYENIFVNHFNPPGFPAVNITTHNGVSPQDIRVIHNTVWVANSSGGIRLNNPNLKYSQYCYGNAVFSASPITNFVENMHNITNSYSSANGYVISATADISTLNLYPQKGVLEGATTPNQVLQYNTSGHTDFNGDSYNWTYRGAYSGCCVNPGWKLQLDTMAAKLVATPVYEQHDSGDVTVFPNPVISKLNVTRDYSSHSSTYIYNLTGELIYSSKTGSTHEVIDFSNISNGIYYLLVENGDQRIMKKIIK